MISLISDWILKLKNMVDISIAHSVAKAYLLPHIQVHDLKDREYQRDDYHVNALL